MQTLRSFSVSETEGVGDILTSVNLVLVIQSVPKQTESYEMGKYNTFAVN